MYRHNRNTKPSDEEQLDRWLVSYADYMTLMFALFVVLYAMMMVKQDERSILTETLTRIFEKTENQQGGFGGSSLLTEQTPQSEFDLQGSSLDEAKGETLLADATRLSDITQQKLGSPLTAIEEELKHSLTQLMEQGLARLEQNDDWLTIELNSGLLFASGSATATSSARIVLQAIVDIIGPIDNFLRIRGYTDNQPINNELFSSNWELSVARATSVLRLLENMNVQPARMAIEGFGEFYPSSTNDTVEGRAENRKVVIAVSRYAYQPVIPQITTTETEPLNNAVEQALQEDGTIRVISLPGGGIRITTRLDNPDALPEQQGQ